MQSPSSPRHEFVPVEVRNALLFRFSPDFGHSCIAANRHSGPTGDISPLIRVGAASHWGQHLKAERFFDVDRQLVLGRRLRHAVYLFHYSQGFHDREIVHSNEADARIVQVDSHP